MLLIPPTTLTRIICIVPLLTRARASFVAKLGANMMDINLAYYLLQDAIVTIILFSIVGTIAALFAAFLVIINE